MNSSIKLFIRGSAVSIIAMILVGGLNYLTRRTMALNLDIDLYGFFYSAFSLSMLIIIYVDLGFNQSATILIAKHLASDKKDKTESTFWSIMLIKLATGLLSATALFLVIDHLLSTYFLFPAGQPILRLFCLFIIVSAVSGLIRATLDAYIKYTVKSYLQVGGAAIILLGVYSGIKEFPHYAPIISYIISVSVIFFLGILYLIKVKNLRYPQKGFLQLKVPIWECWKQGKWIALATAALATMYYMDTIMLTYYSTLKSVALYNIALPIMQIYQSLFVFHIVLTPIASELWHKGQKDDLRTLIKIINLTSILMLVCGSGVIFLTPFNFHMINILFSPDFIAANSALNILSLGMLLLVVGQIYSSTLMAIGKSQTVAYINILASIFNIVANFFLISKYDINGAAAATALSYFFLTCCCVWSFNKVC